jgi:agmatinase
LTNIPDYHQGPRWTFLGLDPATVTYQRSKVAVLPIPYESTTSFMAGTREGPREIIQASRFLELYDEETGTDASAVGIYTLPEIEPVASSPADMVSEIHRAAQSILADGKFLVSLGGEHTITAPLVEAFVEKYPGLSVLQIDAHGDLRDRYHGGAWSHACAMRRVLDLGVSGVQVGIRSISEEEVQALPRLKTRIFYAYETARDPEWRLRAVEALGEPVYVTIDLDGLDPSIMPAVGTPEPGGLGWYETCGLLREVSRRRKVVGFDVNELAPIPGLGSPNFLAAKLVYKFLSYIFTEDMERR